MIKEFIDTLKAFLILLPFMLLTVFILHLLKTWIGNYALILPLVILVIAMIISLVQHNRNIKENGWRIKD